MKNKINPETHNTDGTEKPKIVVRNLSGQTVRLFPRSTKTSIGIGPKEIYEQHTAIRVASEEKTVGVTPAGIPIVGRRPVDPEVDLQMLMAVCPENGDTHVVILHPVAGRVMRSLINSLEDPRNDIIIVSPDLSKDYAVIDGDTPPRKVGTTRLIEIG